MLTQVEQSNRGMPFFIFCVMTECMWTAYFPLSFSTNLIWSLTTTFDHWCLEYMTTVALIIITKHYTTVLTRRTRREQTSLAEAEHYSHIAHCKSVEPCMVWKVNPKRFWIITCTTIWLCMLYSCYGFICSFIHLRIPKSPPQVNS